MLLRSVLFLCAATLTATVAVESAAQSADPQQMLQNVFDCRSFDNNEQRLACYDSAVVKLQSAEQSGEIMTVTRTEVENIEKDSFGFNIPSLPKLGSIFGTSNDVTSAPLTDAPLSDAEIAANASKTRTVSQPRQRPEFKVDEVELTIERTKTFGYKKTRFYFTNGQVWEQTDSEQIRIPRVKDGQLNVATIEKAALGSFLLQMNGKGRGMRVKRVR